VGLLFAGSESQTIFNRIDLVLDHFGVSIDDDGTVGLVSDAELEALIAPGYGIAGEPSTISTIVRNGGTEPLASFGIVFSDETESTSLPASVPALAPGEQAQVDFTWTPSETGPHSLSATLQLNDYEGANNQAAVSVPVLLEPPGVTLRTWRGTARTDAWTTVVLNANYDNEMVVVCTPQYDVSLLGPVLPRVRSLGTDRFEVGLGRPWGGASPGEDLAVEVNCLIARAGVYDEPGFRMEAVRLDGFGAKDDSSSWVGEEQAYGQSYAQPVVVGQVVSSGAGLPGDLGVWSTFWARGATSFDPPSASQLHVGRHTAQDLGERSPESLAYLVVEAGTGAIAGYSFVAGLGAETIRGIEDAPPYDYTLPSHLSGAIAAVASSAGMDGTEGGWPVLYGDGAVSTSTLGLAIEEDYYWDAERSHTTEQINYLVVGIQSSGPGTISTACGLGIELALVLPLLARLRRFGGARRHPA
jgi:hypothetical protein